MDPVIGEAADNCGLSAQFLHRIFPSDLTMWIDPCLVTIGDNSNIYILYEYNQNVSEPWKPAFQMKNKKTLQQQSSDNTHDNSTTSIKTSCEESIRKMDCLLVNPRKYVNIEQLANLLLLPSVTKCSKTRDHFVPKSILRPSCPIRKGNLKVAFKLFYDLYIEDFTEGKFLQIARTGDFQQRKADQNRMEKLISPILSKEHRKKIRIRNMNLLDHV